MSIFKALEDILTKNEECLMMQDAAKYYEISV